MKISKKIISAFCCIAIFISLLPVSASAVDYTSTSDIWTWLSNYTWGLGTQLLGLAADSVCAESADSHHHDTLACVGNLKKDMQEGAMLSEAEILALQMNQQQANMDGVSRPSRKWLRGRKKLRK